MEKWKRIRGYDPTQMEIKGIWGPMKGEISLTFAF